MDAKTYLQQIIKLEHLIENKMLDIAHWKDTALSTTAPINEIRVQTSGNQQQMAAAVANYIDLESGIKNDIQKLIHKRQEIINAIEQLKPAEYDVLYKIYVQDLTLAEVAAALSRSYRWAVGIHSKGLNHIQKILDGQQRG